MCGLVGIVGARADRDAVMRMAAAVAHRGPDDEAVWTDAGVALAHRRLSIIDLSPAGRQPMLSHDGRYRLIFNGEIFNYRELGDAMPGVSWRSSSDSEILLELFARRGPACLDDLVGMFAIAIWDTAERRLFCARDRLGIKPFYYVKLGDGWAFGSEIGALLAAGAPAVANEPILYDFLARDFYEHTDATFFRGVHQLPPGHWMWLAESETPAPRRYWDLAAEAAKLAPPKERVARAEELLARMQDSVRLALRSDVPVGITLSGGLD